MNANQRAAQGVLNKSIPAGEDAVSSYARGLLNYKNEAVLTPDASGNLTGTGSLKSTSPTAGIGYGAGAGGTVTQATSKSTGVTLNKVAGVITMNNASLGAGAEVEFIVTNSAVAAVDVPVVALASGGTAAGYQITVSAVAAGSFKIVVENVSAGSLGEALVINFVVLKGANA